VIRGKGGKDRKIPINDKLHTVLSDYIANIRNIGDSIYFFGTKKTGKLSPQYVNRVIKDTTYRLGWKKEVSAHILSYPNLYKIQTFLNKYLILLD
jgi:integrase/recombinase XerD